MPAIDQLTTEFQLIEICEHRKRFNRIFLAHSSRLSCSLVLPYSPHLGPWGEPTSPCLIFLVLGPLEYQKVRENSIKLSLTNVCTRIHLLELRFRSAALGGRRLCQNIIGCINLRMSSSAVDIREIGNYPTTVHGLLRGLAEDSDFNVVCFFLRVRTADYHSVRTSLLLYLKI